MRKTTDIEDLLEQCENVFLRNEYCLDCDWIVSLFINVLSSVLNEIYGSNIILATDCISIYFQ